MVLKVKTSASPVKRAQAAAKPAARVAKNAGAADAAAPAVRAGRLHNAAPPAADVLSPELEGWFDLMLADIDLRLAKMA